MPKQPDVQYHLAVALQESGDKDKARSLLEQVVKSGASFDGKQDAEKRLADLHHG